LFSITHPIYLTKDNPSRKIEDYCLFKTIPGLGQRYSQVAMKTFSPEESDQVFDPVFF